MESKDNPVSVKQIKNKVTNSNTDISFFDLGEKRIKEYEDKGTFSVSRADQSILNNIEAFNGGKNLSFSDITVSFLDRFKTYYNRRVPEALRDQIDKQLVRVSLKTDSKKIAIRKASKINAEI